MPAWEEARRSVEDRRVVRAAIWAVTCRVLSTRRNHPVGLATVAARCGARGYGRRSGWRGTGTSIVGASLVARARRSCSRRRVERQGPTRDGFLLHLGSDGLGRGLLRRLTV